MEHPDIDADGGADMGWHDERIGFISTFDAMLGNMDVMMLSTGFEAGNGNAIIKPTMRLLYISFMAIMNIVLFNAVIAIMGDRYEAAMDNEQQHPGVNLLARAKYELECENVMPKHLLVSGDDRKEMAKDS